MTAELRDPEARYREVIERARRTNVPAETMARRMAAEDDAGRTEHLPGDHHRYRIECEVCGQRGTIRLSVDPEVAEPDAAVSPVRPEEPPEQERRSSEAWDRHEYDHDAGVNGCRLCGGSEHWPVHRLPR